MERNSLHRVHPEACAGHLRSEASALALATFAEGGSRAVGSGGGELAEREGTWGAWRPRAASG